MKLARDSKQAYQHGVYPLSSDPVALTTVYQPIGEVVDTKGLDDLALWIKLAINTSDLISMRIACYAHTDDAMADPYFTQIQTIGADVVVLADEIFQIGTDKNMVLPLGISELAPYIQLEAKVDTVGATAAEITSVLHSCNRG